MESLRKRSRVFKLAHFFHLCMSCLCYMSDGHRRGSTCTLAWDMAQCFPLFRELHYYCRLVCGVRVQSEWVGERRRLRDWKHLFWGVMHWAWEHFISLCLHNQASWREWECISQKKKLFSPSCSLPVQSSHLSSSLCRGRQSGIPLQLGQCLGVGG